jgi:hypothetical protein
MNLPNSNEEKRTTMTSVDGFVAAVPNANREKSRIHAEKAGGTS